MTAILSNAQFEELGHEFRTLSVLEPADAVVHDLIVFKGQHDVTYCVATGAAQKTIDGMCEGFFPLM